MNTPDNATVTISMAAMEISTAAHKMQFVTGLGMGHDNDCPNQDCGIGRFVADEVLSCVQDIQRQVSGIVAAICEKYEIELPTGGAGR